MSLSSIKAIGELTPCGTGRGITGLVCQGLTSEYPMATRNGFSLHGRRRLPRAVPDHELRDPRCAPFRFCLVRAAMNRFVRLSLIFLTLAGAGAGAVAFGIDYWKKHHRS